MQSRRQYRVIATWSNTSDALNKVFSVQELLNEDDGTEVRYAVQEVTDELLDLRVNESMYFQPNRDDKDSKGIIVRVY